MFLNIELIQILNFVLECVKDYIQRRNDRVDKEHKRLFISYRIIPLPQFSFVFASWIPFLNRFYDRTTLDSLFRPLVLAAICVNRFSSCITLWYIALFTFSFFLSKILRIPDNGEKKFKGFSLLWFSRNLQRCHHQNENSTETFFKKMVNGYQPWLGKEKKWFRERLKCQFHHFKNTPYSKNKHRKSTSCRCLIPFREIWSYNLILQGGRNFNGLVLI